MVIFGIMIFLYLMGMIEMGFVGNVGLEYVWSRFSLDLNLGFEVGESEGMREDVLYGRLLLLYLGVLLFLDFSVIFV